MLLPADVGFVMHLPTDSHYVADHPTTFHWHEHPMRSEVEAQRHDDDNDLHVAAGLIKELHAAMRRAVALIDDEGKPYKAAALLEEHLPEIAAESAARVDAREAIQS